MVDTGKYAATFALLDTDGDGRVSASELKELMATLGEEYSDETAQKAVEIIDTDGDGLISLEELAEYLATQSS
ncbi:MAG TPA: EF-hand domain-containing protein [Acidimicrobiales bacterium]